MDAVLSRHADAIARTTIASLLVQPRTRWHRGDDIRTGWRASRTSFVDVVVLDALSEIMSDLVDAGAAVQGPQWSMAPTNPAYDQARAAAEDARRRAQSYATALGLSVGPVGCRSRGCGVARARPCRCRPRWRRWRRPRRSSARPRPRP